MHVQSNSNPYRQNHSLKTSKHKFNKWVTNSQGQTKVFTDREHSTKVVFTSLTKDLRTFLNFKIDWFKRQAEDKTSRWILFLKLQVDFSWNGTTMMLIWRLKTWSWWLSRSCRIKIYTRLQVSSKARFFQVEVVISGLSFWKVDFQHKTIRSVGLPKQSSATK